MDLSHETEATRYVDQVLTDVAPSSLIIVRGDRPTFALWYGVYAEGRRPDVAIVSGPLMAYVWYRHQIRQQYPDLYLAEPSASEDVTIDTLVQDLIRDNWGSRPIYATDPKPIWEEWVVFEKQDAPIYRARPRGGDGL
jgi:hypothetical protein